MASPPMQPAGTRPDPYKWLAFSANADWVHVDANLLTRMNEVGHRLGKVITIISGYRSPDYSQAHGGYSTDPHTRGVAVDAYIGDVPIGKVPGAMADLRAAGLESGNQPGFYQGNPDPEHVQVPGSGVDKSIHAGMTWGDAGATQDQSPAPSSDAVTPPPDAAVVPTTLPPSSPAPSLNLSQGSNPALPNLAPPDLRPQATGPAGQIVASHDATRQLWQQMAADPLASPETKQIAARLGVV